ncbi:ACL036Wp [Eremothecium gossypii ATCC 10895]|uniref:Golgi to ER traffic protein 2 n=1 Tax=Eremothecium gossypii (strain ATCC 10895 / CBS 109.51 / FGSC 9923 / NRRL Y-1056) TaxID=284811 RepID=GET2_EREGS|nr:ACL036Wp [Eremothecium gossypii ATCC 10895]Q75CF5.1 RecName: Full=Golgi to ER traffic protein 2 [Eremothecium gossypii ATCC 10895]AAS51192.1 ACL036Wp [Eremothecium gossypii ATCC 10895]
MSEVSEAEKRRILREKRKQKFSKGAGSARLHKITTQQPGGASGDSTVTSAEISDNEGSLQRGSNSGQSTREIDDLLAAMDPPIEPAEPLESAAPEVAFIQQLMKMQQGSATPPADEKAGGLFSPLLERLAEQEAGGAPVVSGEVGVHQFQVRQLKAYMLLLRWAILLPFIYYVMHPGTAHWLHTSRFLHFVMEPRNFFMVFTTFEVASISIYYQVLLTLERTNKVNSLSYSSKLVTWAGLVPDGMLPIDNLQGKVVVALHYWDILSMYLTDLSLCLVAAGLMKYYHAAP